MKSNNFSSLEKAISILDLYELEKREFSAQEISRKLDLPLSSVYKYLDFLTKKELLWHKTTSKMYGLGPMITRLGYVLAKDFDLAEVARPHLELLSMSTGETAMLTIIAENQALCLERIEPQRLIKLSLDPGRRLPLNTGASSKILLAFQHDPYISSYFGKQGLVKLTDQSITDPDRLRADLAQIRRDGYAISDSEVDSGARAISLPILDQKNRAVGGLTIAGPTERVEQLDLNDTIKLLKAHAKDISNSMGYFFDKEQV